MNTFSNLSRNTILCSMLFLNVLFLPSCSHMGKLSSKNLPSRSISSVQRIDEDIVESDRSLSDKEEQLGEEISAIPIEINKRVADWIKHFTVTDRERTIRYFKRGSAFKEGIEEILAKKEVPKELFYLAMVESGFVTNAISTANAVGVWQMIKGTARNYGLTVNSHTDERKNWIKSTFAAIDYLKDLRNVFGSWYLAFAAYNAGEYRIVRSIMKGKSRDFWVLAEGKILPRETLNYVPKILAILIIAKHPERYGIRYEEKKSWGEYATVRAPSGIHLKHIQQKTGVPLKVLKEWNKDLKISKIPYTKFGYYEIYIPKKYSSKVAYIEGLKKRRAIARNKRKVDLISPLEKKSRYKIYVVKNKDNLSKIAEELHISVRSLKKLNGIRKSTIYPGQKLRYYNIYEYNYSTNNKRLSEKLKKEDSKKEKIKTKPLAKIKSKPFNKGKIQTLEVRKTAAIEKTTKSTAYYTVKRGDSVYSIAKRHGVSIDAIVKINNIKNFMIYPGQKLSMKKERTYSSIKDGTNFSSGTKGYYHIVKGDSLYTLAKKHNTSVEHLIKINNLKNNIVYPGQKILLKD